MNAQSFEVRLLKKKVYERNFSWESLVKLFQKTKDEILNDLRRKGISQREIQDLEEQVTANEYYAKTIAIVDESYFESMKDVTPFFELNAQLCAIKTPIVMESKLAKDFLDLEYLFLIPASDFEKDLNFYVSEGEKSQKLKNLFATYRFWEQKHKNPIIISPDEKIIEEALQCGLKASKL